MKTTQIKLDSRLGPLYLVASDDGLRGILWRKPLGRFHEAGSAAGLKILKQAQTQIEEYLDGKRQGFDLPLDPQGTEFQKKVWRELAKIPYGKTRSYKDIARALKDPNASRAVGTANGRNPLSIVVPCHRVIASDGSLGGYAGGLGLKVKLLRIEGNRFDDIISR